MGSVKVALCRNLCVVVIPAILLLWGDAPAVMGDPGGCAIRVLVLMVPETPSLNSYWSIEEGSRLNEETRWLLDLYGMDYDQIYPQDLDREVLYRGDDLAYSVVVDNGNRLDTAQSRLLLDAVAGDGLGLVMHTASVQYVSEQLGVVEVPGMGWKDRGAWGEFAIYDDQHYITRLCYAPVERVTHNLAILRDRLDCSLIHMVEPTREMEEGVVLAMSQESPFRPRLAPEIIAEEIGLGRVVWFARPFQVYSLASYFFVERDYVMSFLVARAIEWSSRGGVMVSKWLYPYGYWCAFAIILDGYYDYPPPGYEGPVTSPASKDLLIWRYSAVEELLADLGRRYTASVIFLDDATAGWNAGYDLGNWNTGVQSLRWLQDHGNELALGAYDFVDYEELAESAMGRLEAVSNLRKGREAMDRVFGVDDPVYVFSFVPEDTITGDSFYKVVAEAGFDTMVGGIYKTNFPYDLYGSIYPYYLQTGPGGKGPAVILENSFFFDSLTEATDVLYVKEVYKRHGALVLRIPPWRIYDREDKLSMLEELLDEASKENIWWTTIGELGQYTHQRYDVEVSAESYDWGGRVVVTARNDGDEEVEGFTIKVKLEDDTAPTQHPTSPMGVVSVMQGGEQLQWGENWALEDIGQTPGCLLVWTDLLPGEEVRLEVATTGGRAPVPETAAISIGLVTILCVAPRPSQEPWAGAECHA